MKSFFSSLFIVFFTCAWVFATGNIDATNKYAWAENAGWHNYAPTHGGVTVHTNGANGYLAGYVWAENIGWIKLGAGTGPYANTATNNYGVNLDAAGNLLGYAWSEVGGWINFNPTHSQVTINSTTGSFDGYAWSEFSGWIHFKNDSPAYNVRMIIAPPPFIITPTGVSATDGRYMDKVVLTWSAVSNATGYQVWRHTADDSSAATNITFASQTNYSDTNALVGVLYYYWVKATNAFATSAFSSSDSGWRRSVGYSHYANVDIDGDGKMDLVLFDPVTGTWYAKLSAFGYALVSGVLGGPGCTLVPGDYDGDTKTDPGIYEEPPGLWTVMLSSMSYGTATATLGGMGYIPVPSDFDGDRKTDLGVYLQATGDWTVKLSSFGYAEEYANFGGMGYTPVQRDYDGDGKADPAIYNLTTGNWYVMLSASGYGIASALGFGGPTYTPVPGDYDGDRLGDPAVYQESTGNWYVMLSGSGYLIASATGFGGAGYTPLPGDYDGDGKTDPAVYNTTTSDWYVMLSASGYGIATDNFGGDGYDPVGFWPGQDGWQTTGQGPVQ